MFSSCIWIVLVLVPYRVLGDFFIKGVLQNSTKNDIIY